MLSTPEGCSAPRQNGFSPPASWSWWPHDSVSGTGCLAAALGTDHRSGLWYPPWEKDVENHLQNAPDAFPSCMLQLCSHILSTNSKVLMMLFGLTLVSGCALVLTPRTHLGTICCVFLLQTSNRPHRSPTEWQCQQTPCREEPNLKGHHIRA